MFLLGVDHPGPLCCLPDIQEGEVCWCGCDLFYLLRRAISGDVRPAASARMEIPLQIPFLCCCCAAVPRVCHNHDMCIYSSGYRPNKRQLVKVGGTHAFVVDGRRQLSDKIDLSSAELRPQWCQRITMHAFIGTFARLVGPRKSKAVTETFTRSRARLHSRHRCSIIAVAC